MTAEDYLDRMKQHEHMLEYELEGLKDDLEYGTGAGGQLRREEMYWNEGHIEEIEDELEKTRDAIAEARKALA